MQFDLLYYFLVLSYLFGTIPFGLIIGKLFGLGDVREKGSGNIGATNLFRVGGFFAGSLTFVFDCAKGIIPIAFAKHYTFDNFELLLIGFFAILGHIFPLWLKFKGGKGVATFFAVITFIFPHFGILVVLIWVAVLIATRISGLSAIASISLATPIAFSTIPDLEVNILIFFMCIVIIMRHQDNFKRINKVRKELVAKRKSKKAIKNNSKSKSKSYKNTSRKPLKKTGKKKK
jgi:glycerol-3-phosphate acyltransferase PlsY